jgi:hypothetical protein
MGYLEGGDVAEYAIAKSGSRRSTEPTAVICTGHA